MSRGPAIVRLAVWSVFLVLVLRLLHGSTLGTLSVPLGSLEEVNLWAGRTSPTVMALSLVRLAALVGAWYLVGATVLMLVADVTGWQRLGQAVAAASPAVVRRVATRGASAGLAAGALLGGAPLPAPVDANPGVLPPTGLATPVAPVLALRPAAAGATAVTEAASPPGPLAVPERAPDTATMTRLAAAPTREGDPSTASATATMSRLPDWSPGATRPQPPIPPAPSNPPSPPVTTAAAAPTAATAPTTATTPAAPSTGPGPAAPARPSIVPPTGAPSDPPPGSLEAPAARVSARAAGRTTSSADDEWVVEFGDSFWSIAEEAVAEVTPGRPPSDSAVTAYWRRLIDANRDRLVDPANPDLLLPGQRLSVPAPATSPATTAPG